MTGTFDKTLLDNEICEKIKNIYEEKLVKSYVHNLRKQMVFHERELSSWLFQHIKKFIKDNLGNDYHLIERVTVLKYNKGDFFKVHLDGPHNTTLNPSLPHHFYGGVEISNENDFTGGEFIIDDNPVPFVKGRLFTHGFETLHGVNEVVNGIRWSLHFPIHHSKNFQTHLL